MCATVSLKLVVIDNQYILSQYKLETVISKIKIYKNI